jgi:hypothetical protein
LSKNDLKQITNALLDEPVDIGDPDAPRIVTKREALLMRIVQDAIADEDPAIRQKSAALILNLIDYAGERDAPKKAAAIKNKNGKEI